MLKRFFLNMLSSFVGAWIALALLIVSCFLLLFGMMGSVALSSAAGAESLKSRSILKIDLDGPIIEREMATEPDLMSVLNGNISAPQTLDVIVESIGEAATNDNIVALYLNCGSPAAGPSTLDAIRNALMDFKKKTGGKKKIVAYAESFSQGAYFVASLADEIYMNPAGEFSLTGLASQNFYLKGLFDKLGVQFQVVKVGTYKSAVEPYILTDMSEPARAQMDTLLSNMWQYLRTRMAEPRKKVSAQSIDSLINRDHISFARAELAINAGLVDSLYYDRQVKARLADLAGCEVKKLNFVGPKTMVSETPWSDAYDSKNQIAVLYACGEIADGNSNEINYEDLVPVIIELAEDKNVKGLVLRVNSPGGSVYGSTLIGEALDYFQSKGKPLAVSMGDYAASGGYWISACADRIFADPLTITGSIGIFGMIPNVEGTLDKLGVNIATVSTNPGANFPSLTKSMDASQLDVMQKYVNRGYDDFTSRVAKGRKLPKAKVLAIAEGRVWDAQKAMKIGLVDSLGYLQNAIDWTARKAGVSSSYDVAAYPKVSPNFWMMLQSGAMSMAQIKAAGELHNEELLKQYILQRILSRKTIQARMPEFKVTL